MKTVPVDLKRFSDVVTSSDAVSKEVVKKTKYNKLNLKVNKFYDASTLIHINQYNT